MLEEYVYKNKKKLRLGYTTGSCAAGAARAATAMLLSGEQVSTVELMTPKGIPLKLQVLEAYIREGEAGCAICKDAGDDPDVTDGLLIYASVWKSEKPGIEIDGGEGIGRVTKEGLEQPVGQAAINRVPREMIRENAEEVCLGCGYEGGLKIVISAPGGEELAKKTFNPRLGIQGGISILGTSGIVEPMSEEALIQTIRVDMKMQLSGGRKHVILVPGNYGMDFLNEYHNGLLARAVKYSNFLGEAIDAAVEYGAEGILLAGHIGKLVKLAAGIMNTHSHNADARMEILAAHAGALGATQKLICSIMDCITTDEALDLLQQAGLLAPLMERLMKRMEYYVNFRSGGGLPCGIITFSQKLGILGKTGGVEKMLDALKGEGEVD